MSVAPPPRSTSIRAKLGRPGLLVAAGFAALALVLGGGVAANAGPAPTATTNVGTATALGQLTLTANGFQPNEALVVTLDSAPVQTYAASGYIQDLADATGGYVATVYLPDTLTAGAHTLTVTGTAGGSAATPITIMPQPAATVSPSPVALSAYQSKGVTATFSGFDPGSTVSFMINTPGMGDPAGPDQTVGSDGTVSFTYVPTAGTGYFGPGTYTLTAFNQGDSIVSPVSFTVTPDPATTPGAPVAAPATPVKQTANFTG